MAHHEVSGSDRTAGDLMLQKLKIPDNIKAGVEKVLLSRGQGCGIPLNDFCQHFREVVNQPLYHTAYGYQTLMEFFQTMKDVVRLKYDKADEAWKVYRIRDTGPNTSPTTKSSSPFTVPSTTPHRPQRHCDEQEMEISSICSTEPDPDIQPVDVNKLQILPDANGLYTVGFPPERTPKDWQNMRDMFSIAGPVVTLTKTPRLIYVSYSGADSVRLVMKMFPCLGLKVMEGGSTAQNINKKNLQGPQKVLPQTGPRKVLPQTGPQKVSPQTNDPHQTNVAHSPPPKYQSVAELRYRETGVEVPTIFVTNFPNALTEKDLGRIFRDFNPISVSITESAKEHKKAYIELPSVDMMRSAISEKCYMNIHGLRLRVDVPYFFPNLRKEILGTYGYINPEGHKLHKKPQVYGDQGFMYEHVQTHKHIRKFLNMPDVRLLPGDHVQVTVTHVINDYLFTGQISNKEQMSRLQEILEDLNFRRVHRDAYVPKGPCLAVYSKDKKIHRAFKLCDTNVKWMEVYFLDYGIFDAVMKLEMWTCKDPWVWDLPPLAVPFTLTEPVVNLKDRISTPIMVEVISVDADNMVLAKAVSLVGNWKKAVNPDLVLY